MTNYAKKIEVKRDGPIGKVFLDDVELAAYIPEGTSIEVTVTTNGMAEVRLSLTAEHVVVDDKAVASREALRQAKVRQVTTWNRAPSA